MTINELVELGKEYRDEGEYEDAYKCFLEGALVGDPESIENIGMLYLYGEGVEQSDEKAFRYYRMYYDLSGNKDFIMNIMDIRDEILERSSGRRIYRELLEYMIEQGEWDIYIIKGAEIYEGIIYPKSSRARIECYEIAISHGISMGYECLGEMYYLGEGVEQNYKKAYEYFQSFDGYVSFMKPFYLGELYRCGHYVEKDIEKAKNMYREIVDSSISMKSVDSFYEKAVEYLRSLENVY